MRVRHPQRDDSGTAAVEMALVMPLLLVLILGILGFGQAFRTSIELSNAAQEGARTLVFQVGATGSDAVAATIAAAALTPALTSADVTASAACAPAADVTVTARRRITFSYYLGGFDRVITGRAVMRCAG